MAAYFIWAGTNGDDASLAVCFPHECTWQNGAIGAHQRIHYEPENKIKNWLKIGIFERMKSLVHTVCVNHDDSTNLWNKEPHFFYTNTRQHARLVTRTPEGSGSHIGKNSRFSPRWCRGKQLPSYAVRRGGLETRSTPLSFAFLSFAFLSFFFFPGAQAMALERQLPWARLRTVHGDGESERVKEQ